MMTSRLGLFTSALVGAIAAVVTSAGLARISATKAAAPETPADGPRNLPVQVMSDPPPNWRQFPTEVAAPVASASAAGTQEEQPPPPDPVAARAQADEFIRELEHQHSSDPIDPGWSRQATNSLSQGLAQLGAARGFTVASTDCRTTMCRATVRWDNYAGALKGRSLAVERVPGFNCERSITMKPPENPTAPYTADLYLNCTEQRAGNVDIIPQTKENENEMARHP